MRSSLVHDSFLMGLVAAGSVPGATLWAPAIAAFKNRAFVFAQPGKRSPIDHQRRFLTTLVATVMVCAI
jgi:hypothetical protein